MKKYHKIKIMDSLYIKTTDIIKIQSVVSNSPRHHNMSCNLVVNIDVQSSSDYYDSECGSDDCSNDYSNNSSEYIKIKYIGVIYSPFPGYDNVDIEYFDYVTDLMQSFSEKYLLIIDKFAIHSINENMYSIDGALLDNLFENVNCDHCSRRYNVTDGYYCYNCFCQ